MDTRPLVALFNESWIMVPTDPADRTSPLRITDDLARLPEADAVAFHLPTLTHGRPSTRVDGQLWIACWMESEIYYPFLLNREFMSYFNLTMSYRRQSDVWTPYFESDFCDSLRQPLSERAGGVVYIQSNDFDRCGRRDLVRRLMRRVKIDSYGRSLQNKTLPEDRGRVTKLETFARYRFTLAFENSIAEDYVTEKFYEPLLVGSVPVYRGAPNIDELAPAPDSFIDARTFASPEDLAAYLNHLLLHDDEYNAYLAWRQRGPSAAFAAALDRIAVHPLQRLAGLISERKGRRAGGDL